ncbi:MAG: diacylglycerol kinase [Clostridioides sp.]|jgi:diacylglycerol kinase (ATP)|nr:diacylglycerol kinase [Clostridioides sp.]
MIPDNSKFDKKGGKKRRGLINAFNDAIAGILYTFKSERNMKIHYLGSALVLVISLFLNLSKLEMIMLFMSIAMVVVAEMFNTAVEKAIDLITDEYHALAKIAKDVSAGAVLVSALNSVVVGYILFYDKLTELSVTLIHKLRQSELHITLICIILVLLAVVVVKALTSSGTPLKGGMPSGHAALAFAIATAITLMTERVVASTLAYIMAVLVAQSRIEGKIHSFWETFAGALLGTLIAVLVFQYGIFYSI